MGHVRIYVEKIQHLLTTEPNPAAILKALCNELDHSAYPLAKKIATLSFPQLNMVHIVNIINGSPADYPKEGEFAALLCAFLICYRHYEQQFTPQIIKQLPSRSGDAWLSHYAITPSSFAGENKKTNIVLLAKIDFDQPLEEKERQGYVEALLKNIKEFLRENTQPLDDEIFLSIVNGLKKAYFILPIETESVLESIILPISHQPNWDRFCILFELRHFPSKKLYGKIEEAINQEIHIYSKKSPLEAMQLKWLCLFECIKKTWLLESVSALGKDRLSEFLSAATITDSFDLFACLARIQTRLSVSYQIRILKQAAKDFINHPSCQPKLLTLATLLHPSVSKKLVELLFSAPVQAPLVSTDQNLPQLASLVSEEKSERTQESALSKTMDSIIDDEEVFQFLVRLVLMLNLSASDCLEAAHSLKQLAQQKKYDTPKYDMSFFLFSLLSAPFKTEADVWGNIETFLYNKEMGLASPSATKESDKTSTCITLIDFFSSALFTPAFQKKQIASLENMYDKQRDKPIVQLGILTVLSHFGLDQFQEKLKLADVISMLDKETSGYPADFIAPLLMRLQKQLPADPSNDLSQLPVVTDSKNVLYRSTAGLPLLSCLSLQTQTAYIQPFFTSESMTPAFISFIVSHSLDEQLFLSHTLLSNKKNPLLDIRAHHIFLHSVSLLLRTSLIDKNIVWLLLSYLPLEKEQKRDDLDATAITRYLFSINNFASKEEKRMASEEMRISQSTHALFRCASNDKLTDTSAPPLFETLPRDVQAGVGRI